MRVWNKSHHGSIMLYGHSHGTLDEMTINTANPTWMGDQYFIKNYRTMDVGVDTHNLYPYHLDEIIDIMKGRDLHMEIDHHNALTN
jgi:calcineurin-like phosphoesterase family protein